MTINRTWRGCVFIGVSLDGYIAKPDGDISWLTDPVAREHAAAATSRPALEWETFYAGIDALVMGRSTYETVAGFDQWPFEGTSVIVLSTTLSRDDRVQIARSVGEVVELLTNLGATRVYIDGGRTIQTFLAAGLVDEITVSIAPILLGRGRKLFGDLDADVHLTLRGHHATSGDGLVRVTYDVEPRGAADLHPGDTQVEVAQ